MPAVDWERISRFKPDLRIMIQVTSPSPFSLEDLSDMAQLGMHPADRDPALVLGLKKAIFSVKQKHWNPNNLPTHLQARRLNRFILSGIYRVSFKVEQPGYEGPLSLEIATPRDGFGQQLIYSENLVRPRAPHRLYIDPAGNRWFRVDYPNTHQGETLKFFFAFRYQVDMASLLNHDLMLLDKYERVPIPENIQPFLLSGRKIDTQNPIIMEWVQRGGPSGPLNARSEYLKAKQFIDKTIRYNETKKGIYFGGKAVYSNLDDMYQDITVTLSQKLGACPDTSLLECAFLRAKGIPCRTAGRFGHFLTHLYVPGKGWLSTLIHPTGVPLVIAPGPDNVSYQKWSPQIALRTLKLENKIRIEAVEDLP